MFASGILVRGKAALQGTETEQRVSNLICDDTIQVISSFELNQIASLTYHEGSIATDQDITDQIFEILLEITSKPVSHSTLSVQKALVVTKHILIFGPEKVIQAASPLKPAIHELLMYNTALIAQQQSGASGMFFRLKGGSVDKGGPVRELAAIVYRFLTQPPVLMFERNAQADPDSLVPIGNNNVAFCTDQVRQAALQKRLREQERINVKSNLVKANDGFGGGYTATDGKVVVGAAHGLEEMMKIAEIKAAKEKQKFSDSGTGNNFSEYQAPEFGGGTVTGGGAGTAMAQMPSADLLFLGHSTMPQASEQPEVDLLDFSSSAAVAVPTPAASDFDLMGMGSAVVGSDPFGLATATTLPSTNAFTANMTPSYSMTHSTEVSDMYATSTQPLSSSSGAVRADPNPIVASSMSSTSFNPPAATSDPFAALDALGPVANASLPQLSSLGSSAGTAGSSSSGPSTDALTDLTSLAASQLHLGMAPSNFSTRSTTTASNSNTSNTTMMSTMPHSNFATPAYESSSLKVSGWSMSDAQSAVNDNDDDDENGFVMGGSSGAGLQPIGQAPAAPPPPPPPTS